MKANNEKECDPESIYRRKQEKLKQKLTEKMDPQGINFAADATNT